MNFRRISGFAAVTSGVFLLLAEYLLPIFLPDIAVFFQRGPFGWTSEIPEWIGWKVGLASLGVALLLSAPQRSPITWILLLGALACAIFWGAILLNGTSSGFPIEWDRRDTGFLTYSTHISLPATSLGLAAWLSVLVVTIYRGLRKGAPHPQKEIQQIEV